MSQRTLTFEEKDRIIALLDDAQSIMHVCSVAHRHFDEIPPTAVCISLDAASSMLDKVRHIVWPPAPAAEEAS